MVLNLFAREHKPELVHQARMQIDEWRIFVNYINTFYEFIQFAAESGENKIALYIANLAKTFLFESNLSEQLNNAFFLRMIDYTKYFPLVEGELNKTTIKDFLANPEEIISNLLEKTSETIK